MLTISPIRNSTGAAKYFAKEDGYYLSEVDAKENSIWWGIGADKLRLINKKVLEKDLQESMEGRLQNGVTIGLQKDGSIKHRAGYDLCFHAPKSVSILALEGGDKRFYQAHLEAVKETLKAIEEECAQARVYNNNKEGFENTKNLTIALIRHTASRSLDPHLHHHALIMNATERQDKTWRALASSMTKTKTVNGFLEKIYHKQIYYGLIYRTSLANRVQKLGCEIEIVGKHGMWEIKGVPKEVRDTMSKRRKEIEELLSKLNYRSFKAADMASLDSREKKPKHIRLAEMKQTWKDELTKVGFSSKEFLANLEKNKDKKLTEKFELQKIEAINLAVNTVKDATWYLSQYELKLDYTKIISKALEFSIGKTTHQDIVLAANQLIKDGFLISLDKSDTFFVTRELIETEKAIMDLVDKGKNRWSDFILKDNDSNNTISDEIKKCAGDILQSKHRVILVESNRPDNKDLIRNILNLAESSGKTVRVLSPNRGLANDINENVTRPKPSNIWQWLVSFGKPEVGESIAGFRHKYKEEVELPAFLLRFKQGKDVIIVNDAEMVGCNDKKTILELTDKSQAKVIFLQNTADKRGFNSGNSITTLKQAGIERFELKASESGKIQAAGVTPELKIIKTDDKRILQLAKEYAQKYDKENTVILVGSKKQLEVANDVIRKELKEKGKILGLEYNIPVLNPVYLSKPEAILAHKYQQNMVIRFYGGVSNDWNVGYCDRETNTLRLTQNKRKIIWNPKKQQNEVKYGVFKKETLQVAKGDKLIAASNMHNLGIKNGTKFIVGGVSNTSIELLSDIIKTSNTKEPKTIKISLDKLKNSHFQYNYATTINRSLKKPAANIIADFKAYLLDKPTIEELTKRAQKSLIIFTNDGEVAQKRFGHIPTKLTAVETLLDTSRVLFSTGGQEEKTLSDKITSEIKSDLEKAIKVLRDQYAFRSQDERKAVEFALEKITSRNAGFTKEDLAKEALEYALKELIAIENKEVTKQDIEKIIKEKCASGELIIGKQFTDGVKLTTKKELKLEHSILASVKKGKNKLAPLLVSHAAVPASDFNLTKGQNEAVSLITTTKDQYVIIQGYAGVGKTKLFSQVHKTLKEANNNRQEKIRILGLAPTHKAVKELRNVGIKAQTLASFLTKHLPKKVEDCGDKKPDSLKVLDNKLIILDESSMVSNQEYAQFDSIINKTKAHVALSGDTSQHISIGSGKPVEITQKSHTLKTAYLKEIVRQKNLHLKEAVVSVIGHNYEHAFDKVSQLNPQSYIERINHNSGELDLEFFKNLQTSVIEINNEKLEPEEKTLEQMVAEDFLTRTPEAREQTVIIVHANDDRAVITEFIRDGLKKQGAISKNGIKINRLADKGLTNAEHKSLRSYYIGNVVKLGKQYFHVMEVDLKARSLLLRDGSGKTRYFYPEKEVDRCNMELYSHTREELAVGDEIRLTKTDKKRGLFANFEYRVKAIDDKQATLESKNEQKPPLVLNHRRLKDTHWDYAQTVTSYGFQGGSKRFAIAFEVSYRKFLANVRSFYISISRAIEHLIIYTDNKNKFLRRLNENLGEKYAALEVTGELEELAKKELAKTESTQLDKVAKTINAKFYNVKDATQILENSAELVVERLLGKPNEKLSSATEWRYGNKGSFSIKMAGDKRGLWHNFETNESGNLITLIQKGMSLNFSETLKYVSETFGNIKPTTLLFKGNVNMDSLSKTETNNKATSEKGNTDKYAQKLAKESLPITRTIVEKYLKEHRGIKSVDTNDIRYHPRVFTSKNESQQYLPAMLSIGRNKDGKVQCVQATYLNPKTANKADLAVKKRTYASPSGALVSLQKQENVNDYKNKLSFIAEGIETGLSIKDAIGDIRNGEILVTLGKSNFINIDPKQVGDRVIFCLDYDGPKNLTDTDIHKAAERLINFGKKVFIATPKTNEKNNKIDFNDIAKNSGVAAVRNNLDGTLPYNEWKNNTIKNTFTNGNEINLDFTEKVIQKDPYSNQKYATFLKKPEIDLTIATRFIDLDPRKDFAKYLSAYSHMQNKTAIQKSIETTKNLNVDDIQKSLSKIEKEMY